VKLLYAFTGGPLGGFPTGRLLQDKTGALYGTTTGLQNANAGYGTVFRLTPPAGTSGTWTQTVLFHFKDASQSGDPTGGLLMDEGGALYGTASGDPNSSNGAVFKLTPPQTEGGAWSETILVSEPRFVGDLARGPGGTLYAVWAATVISLTPPPQGKSAWKSTTLYQFPNPVQAANSGVSLGSDGALYGTLPAGPAPGNSGFGLVYRLEPPTKRGDPWTETDIYVFAGAPSDGATPSGNLVLDTQGNLYGTTQSGGAGNHGTVFKLAPPAGGQGPWAETILHSFSGSDGEAPMGGLTLIPSGVLYGTTSIAGATGGGTIFRLTPASDSAASMFKTMFNFYGGHSRHNPDFPFATLIRGTTGVFYGTTRGGGLPDCRDAFCGTVYQFSQ
jgi:uncharacterized repeat protein (TIGR03803 family)